MLSAKNPCPILFLNLDLIIFISEKDLSVVAVETERVITRRNNLSSNNKTQQPIKQQLFEKHNKIWMIVRKA